MKNAEEIKRYIDSVKKELTKIEEARRFLYEIEQVFGAWSTLLNDLQIYVSKTKEIQGVLFVYNSGSKWILVSESERSTRELLRKLPENCQCMGYYDEKWRAIILEYIFVERDYIFEPYCIKGYRASSEYMVNRQEKLENLIDTKKHPVVAEIREYNTLSGRIKNERLIVEGMRLVTRALEDKLPVEKVIYSSNDTENLDDVKRMCDERKIRYYKTTPGILAAMTTTHPTPEIVCSVRHKVRNQKELILANRRNFFVILDGISNPDNLGIILRTVDAAGISGLILLSNCTHYMNKNAIRGGRGAIGRIPIYVCDNDNELFEMLIENKFKIIGTSARFEAANFYDLDYNYENICVVLGNESDGIRDEILDKCTDYLKIPMAEGQSSLNIAVASALVMYEYVRNIYG